MRCANGGSISTVGGTTPKLERLEMVEALTYLSAYSVAVEEVLKVKNDSKLIRSCEKCAKWLEHT